MLLHRHTANCGGYVAILAWIVQTWRSLLRSDITLFSLKKAKELKTTQHNRFHTQSNTKPLKWFCCVFPAARWSLRSKQAVVRARPSRRLAQRCGRRFCRRTGALAIVGAHRMRPRDLSIVPPCCRGDHDGGGELIEATSRTLLVVPG